MCVCVGGGSGDGERGRRGRGLLFVPLPVCKHARAFLIKGFLKKGTLLYRNLTSYTRDVLHKELA